LKFITYNYLKFINSIFFFFLQLSNINDHIQIIMCILKFNFIDKKSLKKQLKELVVNNYLMIEDTQKIYNLNIENIMKKINIHKNTNIYVNKIMSISRESYYMTAAFYNVTLFLLFLYQQ